MLREILSISGKSGLFKIISHGKKLIIVEDLTTKKRFPAMSRDKIISLGDISMYTDSGDKPLGEILEKTYAKFDGKEINVKKLAAEGKLKETFGEIIEDFDRDRVYDSDVKKLFTWYNILTGAGITKFVEEEKVPKEKTDE